MKKLFAIVIFALFTPWNAEAGSRLQYYDSSKPYFVNLDPSDERFCSATWLNISVAASVLTMDIVNGNFAFNFSSSIKSSIRKLMREVDGFYSHNRILPTGVECGNYSLRALRVISKIDKQIRSY